jgi:hypothetical protein
VFTLGTPGVGGTSMGHAGPNGIAAEDHEFIQY